MTEIQSSNPAPNPSAPDFAAIKSRQQATWATGDYARIGATLQIVGETLCEAVDVQAGERVLDVAAGNGNASLAAARCRAEVVATDYVPTLLDVALRRAEVDGLSLETRFADAEALPFADGSFDVVLSTFGVMFTPDAPRAASELARVCRPGGRIGLASWTPDSFIGELFKTIGRFVPPPPGVASPMRWGDEAIVKSLFGTQAHVIHARIKPYVFRYRSAHDFIEFFRTYYGPTNKAFAALSEDQRPELARAIAELVRRFDRGRGGAVAAVGDYLEIVLERDA